MLYMNSLPEIVSAPHNDIEHKKIANLNRRSLTVPVAKAATTNTGGDLIQAT